MDGASSIKRFPMPTIEVFPEDALVDKVVRIVIEKLRSRQNITVYATLRGNGDDIFDSYAHYKANGEGVVDFCKDPSIGGSYDGVEPMGLFWSMKPSPINIRPHSRFVMRDVERPVNVEITIYDSHLQYKALKDSPWLTRGTVRRWYKDEKVQRIPVRHGRLRGTLFIPSGCGPFPTVVDIFGTAGGLMEFRASLLASHGFLTLALAYFGFDDLPDTAFHVDLTYFEEARIFLQKHPAAAKCGTGVIGVSVGGTLALAIATYIPGFTCVASINGPVFVHYSSMEYGDRIWRVKAMDMNRLYVEDNALVLHGCLEDHWDKDLGESEIEFHKSDSSFLFMFSEDDKAINTKRAAAYVHNVLQGRKHKYDIITYPGAGHLLEPPFSPHGLVTHTKLFNLPQKWGGTPREHSNAQVKAWDDTIQFLRKHLAPKAGL